MKTEKEVRKAKVTRVSRPALESPPSTAQALTRQLPLVLLAILLLATTLSTAAAPASASISPSEVVAATGCDSSDCGEDAGIDTGDPSAETPRLKKWEWTPYVHVQGLGFNLGRITLKVSYIENDNFLVDTIQFEIDGQNPQDVQRRPGGSASDIKFKGPKFNNFFKTNTRSTGRLVSMTGPIKSTITTKATYSSNGRSVRHVVTAELQINRNNRTCDAKCKTEYRGLRFPAGRGVSASGKTVVFRFDKTFAVGSRGPGYPWGCRHNEQGNWRCPGDGRYVRPIAQPTPSYIIQTGGGSGSKHPVAKPVGPFTCRANSQKYISNGQSAYRQNGNLGNQRICNGVSLDFHAYCGGKVVAARKPHDNRPYSCTGGGSGSKHPVAKPVGPFTCGANSQKYISNGQSAYRQNGNLGNQRICNGVSLDFHVYCGGKAVLALKPDNHRAYGCTSDGRPRPL